MKNVLVLVHEDAGQEARLQAALDLTRALSGHLVCLDVTIPPAALDDYFSDAGGTMMMEAARAAEANNRRQVEARLQREDVSWSMLDRSGAPARALRNEADLADVIVVSLPEGPGDGDYRQIVGEVVAKSERPVLAVPGACRGINVGGRVLIGWNASHESSEAVRQAVPILQLAQSVTLLDVNHPSGDFSVEEAASYLSRHGIHARIVNRDSAGQPVSEVILKEAHAMEAAYVVIGAYGVPRPIEAIFGGVTASMFAKSDMPIFLAR